MHERAGSHHFQTGRTRGLWFRPACLHRAASRLRRVPSSSSSMLRVVSSCSRATRILPVCPEQTQVDLEPLPRPKMKWSHSLEPARTAPRLLRLLLLCCNLLSALVEQHHQAWDCSTLRFCTGCACCQLLCSSCRACHQPLSHPLVTHPSGRQHPELQACLHACNRWAMLGPSGPCQQVVHCRCDTHQGGWSLRCLAS